MEKVALVLEIYFQPYARYNAVRDNKRRTDVCDSARGRTTSTWTDGVEEDQDVEFTCILVFMRMYFVIMLLSRYFVALSAIDLSRQRTISISQAVTETCNVDINQASRW